MFSYYGSKSKVIDYYPAPEFTKIIEPFAGSARYALKYWDRDILLVDKYEVIVKVWHYLQQASKQDIMRLPEPKYKEDIRNFGLCEGELLLLSFLVARGAASSQYIVQQFSDIKLAKVQIAQDVDKIRHWTIQLGDYREIPTQQATWFIDPPYFIGGREYRKSEINYPELAKWCMSCQGQVIVCENTKANWLPFTPLVQMRGAYSETTEAIWTNRQQQLGFSL